MTRFEDPFKPSGSPESPRSASRGAGREPFSTDSVVVGTSALREARNGGVFVEACREKFGIEVRILTGDEEAKPNQPVKPAPVEPVAPKPQPEDTQLKKALELLRDKPAAPAQRAA